MLYAAYGSNLHPVRLVRRTPSAELLGARFVPGWQLTFHKRSPDRSGKCMVTPCGSGIFVAVYDIDEAEKQVLDEIEGVGNGYRDDRINVPDFGRCRTYLPQDDWIDTTLRPWDWYRDLVWLGCRYHGFPAAYCDAIASVTAPFDPDSGRRRVNEHIIAALGNDAGTARCADRNSGTASASRGF